MSPDAAGGAGDLHRMSRWSDWSVTVAGIGIAGFACADALMQLGARVTVIDSGDGAQQRERSQILEMLGVRVLLGHEAAAPDGTELLVVSPGLRPSAPVIVDALERRIPVWGELELAWRLRDPDTAAAWLCVTGTNGKTTTTLMLESMLRAAGYRTMSAGNIGHSLVDVVMHDELDVIAIEVGAPQLPFVHTVSPVASVCLNIADDHIDHFGSMEAYIAAKAKVYERTQEAAVYNVQDETTLRMVEAADVVEGCRAIGSGTMLRVLIPAPPVAAPRAARRGAVCRRDWRRGAEARTGRRSAAAVRRQAALRPRPVR